MGILLDYIEANRGAGIVRWRHYLEALERHLERFRGRDVHVLEFGVLHGGSLHMWRHFFGARSRIYGVDIDPRCARFEADGIRVFTGDQGDRVFLRRLRDEIPQVDVVIDDGGHTMTQQIATFEELFPHVSERGMYVCEDLHTSYWEEFGGGMHRPGTFIEYAKRLIDQLNAWHTRDRKALDVDDFTLTTHAMHFYDSILFIEKRPMQAPEKIRSGVHSF